MNSLHRTMAVVLPTLLLLILPGSAHAEQPVAREPDPQAGRDNQQGQVDVNEIVIKAKRDHASEYCELDEDDLARERFSKTIDGLLTDMAGVDLTRKSIAGSDRGKVLLRGFDESRFLILLDGRSLNGAGVYGGYFVDWSALSLEDVERIEVIRGAAPVKYGNTLGGVLNIITRTGSDKSKTAIRVSGGSLGSWDAQLAHAWRMGPLLYSVSAGHHETDGFLRNAYLKHNKLSGKFAMLLPWKLKLSASASYSANECGMAVYNQPDSPYYDPGKPDSLDSQLGGPYVPFLDHGYGRWGARDWGTRSHWNDGRAQFDLSLSRSTEHFSASARAYLMEQTRREFYYAVDDPLHLILDRRLRPEKHNWGWRIDLKNILEAMGTHVIEYGAEGTYLGYGGVTINSVDDSYVPPFSVSSIPDPSSQISMLHGIYLQDAWHLNDWFEAGLGLRFDNFVADGPEENAPTLNDTTWSPRVELTVLPWLDGRVTARYRWSHRFPNLPEYYWWYSGYQPADRKPLTPEDAHMFELEVGQKFGQRFQVSARAYHYRVANYIRWIFGYRPSRLIYNIDGVDFTGLEMEATCQLLPGLQLWANYTWQLATKTGDVLDHSSELSTELVELPRNKLSLGLAYHAEEGLQARFSARYVDLRRAVVGDLTTSGESRLEKLAPYVDLELYASYPLLHTASGGQVRAELSIQNLLNRSYVEEYGYPLPGIVFMTGLRLTM